MHVSTPQQLWYQIFHVAGVSFVAPWLRLCAIYHFVVGLCLKNYQTIYAEGVTVGLYSIFHLLLLAVLFPCREDDNEHIQLRN